MTNDILLIFLNDTKEQNSLSQALGEEKLKEINKKLHTHTLLIAQNIKGEKHIYNPPGVYFINALTKDKYEPENPIIKRLNERIKYAFDEYILQDKNEVSKVIYITADCPQLTQEIIEKAFESLNKYDVCIGPEKKGGYYLIGMKEPLPFLFESKLWKGNNLLDDTLEELIEHGKNYFLLPELQRVNDIYDLHLLK